MPLYRWTERSGKCPCTCEDDGSSCATNPSSGRSWRSGIRTSWQALVAAATNSSMPKLITPTIMNAEKPSLAVALKTLWGASQMPFGEACAEPFRHPSFEELTRRLQQLCDIGASGLLHGANGVGKSYLCGCFTEKLPEKRYKILSLVHSSLTGSELIRALCRQLGVAPQMRRSDNVDNIHAAFARAGQPLAAAGARRSTESLGLRTRRGTSVDLCAHRHPGSLQSASGR